MREIRPSGSEGGGPGKLPGLPTPISRALAAERKAVVATRSRNVKLSPLEKGVMDKETTCSTR